MNFTNPLDFLVFFLSNYENGRALLTHGTTEYKFVTKAAPRLVWIAESESGTMPVCQGNINTFGVRLMPDGFVLVADVQTESVEVSWQAILESSTQITI